MEGHLGFEHLGLVGEAAPLGAAGIVAWMWLAERRGAAERERALGEAHRRVMEQRVQLDELMKLVRDNTRAVVSLEAGQRRLARTMRAMVASIERRDAGSAGSGRLRSGDGVDDERGAA